MIRFIKICLLLLACSAFSQEARAFSLLGPYANDGVVWQTARIGYNIGGDIGGPMNIGQEYRWNLPQVFYAYSDSFLTFFGARGVDEVDKAVKFLNDLPTMSTVNIDNYPLKTERINHQAQALRLFDLKSVALT